MRRDPVPELWQSALDPLCENDIVPLDGFFRNGLGCLCGGNDMIHLMANGLKYLLDDQAVAVCESQDFHEKTSIWLGVGRIWIPRVYGAGYRPMTVRKSVGETVTGSGLTLAFSAILAGEKGRAVPMLHTLTFSLNGIEMCFPRSLTNRGFASRSWPCVRPQNKVRKASA